MILKDEESDESGEFRKCRNSRGNLDCVKFDSENNSTAGKTQKEKNWVGLGIRTGFVIRERLSFRLPFLVSSLPQIKQAKMTKKLLATCNREIRDFEIPSMLKPSSFGCLSAHFFFVISCAQIGD